MFLGMRPFITIGNRIINISNIDDIKLDDSGIWIKKNTDKDFELVIKAFEDEKAELKNQHEIFEKIKSILDPSEKDIIKMVNESKEFLGVGINKII